MIESQWIILIVILAILFGYYYCRYKKKVNDNIIKIEYRRDMLPAPGEGGPWIQDAICYMGDKSIGKVKGLYCEQIRVL